MGLQVEIWCGLELWPSKMKEFLEYMQAESSSFSVGPREQLFQSSPNDYSVEQGLSACHLEETCEMQEDK